MQTSTGYRRAMGVVTILSLLMVVMHHDTLRAEVGVVHRMSVLSDGGRIEVGRMGRLEAMVKPGSGNHRVTGISERQSVTVWYDTRTGAVVDRRYDSSAKVLKESFGYALTWVEYQLPRLRVARSLKTLDVQVHFDDMAIPKDGPSASAGMGLVILSAITGIPILPGVAITGEITPRGGITPVGGVREKVAAAIRGGATTIILPRGNAGDVPQLADSYAGNVLVVAADTMDIALSYAMGESSPWGERYRSRAALLTEVLVALAQGQSDVATRKGIQAQAQFPEDLWLPVSIRKRMVRGRIDFALDKAKELSGRGDLEGAAAQLEEASRHVGESAELTQALRDVKTLMGRPDFEAGKRAMDGGDPEAAHRALTRAVQTAPHATEYQDALKQAAVALAEAQYAAGMRHLDKQEHADAYKCLKRAAELVPGNADYQKEMLRARVLTGSAPAAADPDGAATHRRLAAALRASGRKAEAVEEYRLAIRQQPEDGGLRHESVSITGGAESGGSGRRSTTPGTGCSCRCSSTPSGSRTRQECERRGTS